MHEKNDAIRSTAKKQSITKWTKKYLNFINKSDRKDVDAFSCFYYTHICYMSKFEDKHICIDKVFSLFSYFIYTQSIRTINFIKINKYINIMHDIDVHYTKFTLKKFVFISSICIECFVYLNNKMDKFDF